MKAVDSSRTGHASMRWRVNLAVMRVLLWPKDLVTRTFPPSIRHLYWLVLSGVQAMILYGWGSFWRRYRRYRQNENNVLKWRMQLKRDEDRQTVFEIAPGQFQQPEKLRLAVVVHAYYAELFNGVCSYLKNMPCPYTLLISVKSEDDKQAVSRQASSLPMVQKTVVKIVENRGRDIKPLLVDFASELSDFDYICKVHTKKSLYTGEEKMDRRQYLYKMVIGSRQRIQAILTVFARDPGVGIIYPARYEEMPYWCYTWLSNKWTAAPFVNRLGFDFDPDEYIDYPSGSMCWFKKEALKPLLDMRLTGTDFPEERGQNDGALQHVIERCFTLSARSAGFKYAVINDLNKDVFSYTDAMKISSYFNMPPADRIRDELNLAEVVSFDIFDTLLCRPFASPKKVFQYLEEIVQQRYGVKGFMRLRQEAEANIRGKQGQSDDVKISQVYQALAGMAGIGQDVADGMLELELITEINLLVPRRDMLNAFEEVKRAGKRIILTTDTYFERPHIERVLTAKGITGYHKLYISSEEGKRKARGDMWDHVIAQEQITANNFLHIGDNEQSDVQMLIDRGYPAVVHVMKPSVLFRQSAHGQYLWQMLNPRKGWRENLLYGMLSNHFCLDTYPYDFWYSKKPLSDPYALGYTVFGPFMHNFLAWAIRSARRDSITHLYFLSREGYAMQKMYSDIAGSAAFKRAGIELPGSSYLLASRRASLFAALRRPEDVLPLLEKHFTGTLRYLLEKRMNVSAANIQAIERVLGTDDLTRKVSLPEDYTEVRNSLFKVFDILELQAEVEREPLLSYYGGQGMKAGGKMGLVDAGYSCTIQKALVKLLDVPLNGYYIAIDNDADKTGGGGSLSRSYLGGSANPALNALIVLKYRLLLEAILTAPQGQLLYFNAGREGVIPVFKPPGVAQKRFDIISRMQDGMQGFVRDMLYAFGAGMLDVEFPLQPVLLCYQMVATGMTGIGDLKAALSVEDEYCGTPELAVIDHYVNMKHHENGLKSP